MTKPRIDAEEIRRRYHTDPFRPFAVVLRDGTRIAIKQRQRFGVAPSGSFMIAAFPNGDFTTIAMADIDAIVEGKSGSRRKAASDRPRRRKAG